jgi:hypothetical protein
VPPERARAIRQPQPLKPTSGVATRSVSVALGALKRRPWRVTLEGWPTSRATSLTTPIPQWSNSCGVGNGIERSSMRRMAWRSGERRSSHFGSKRKEHDTSLKRRTTHGVNAAYHTVAELRVVGKSVVLSS